jgi:hypothetical protein
VIGMNDPAGLGVAVGDGHPERVGDQRRGLAGVEIDQPTTLREKVSSTTAQYTLPSSVRCSVMSATHNRFGASRVNIRSTRSLRSASRAGAEVAGYPAVP